MPRRASPFPDGRSGVPCGATEHPAWAPRSSRDKMRPAWSGPMAGASPAPAPDCHPLGTRWGPETPAGFVRCPQRVGCWCVAVYRIRHTYTDLEGVVGTFENDGEAVAWWFDYAHQHPAVQAWRSSWSGTMGATGWHPLRPMRPTPHSGPALDPTPAGTRCLAGVVVIKSSCGSWPTAWLPKGANS